MLRRLAMLVFLPGALASAQPAVDDDDPDPAIIERLVADLGHDEFRQREAAMIALRKIGDPAIAILRRQQNSADVEQRQRVLGLLRDIEKKGQLFCFTGHDKAIISLALLPGDTRVLSAGADQSIRLWDLTVGKQLGRFDGHTKEVWALAVAPGGKSFSSSGQDCAVRLWTLDGDPKPRVLATLPHYVRCLLFSADGQRLIVGAFDSKIYVIDIKTGKTTATWAGQQDAVTCLALSPDGRKILSGGGLRDSAVLLRDARTGEILQRLAGHQEHVHAVAFVDDAHAISAGYDNIVRLWNLKTGQVEREFKGHSLGVYSVAVSKDRKRLLTGAQDKTIRLWDLSTGDELRRFSQHEDGVNAVGFTANGRYALSASSDRTVRMWYLPRVPKKSR